MGAIKTGSYALGLSGAETVRLRRKSQMDLLPQAGESSLGNWIISGEKAHGLQHDQSHPLAKGPVPYLHIALIRVYALSL